MAPVLNIALKRFKSGDEVRSAELVNLSVLINAILYNAASALQVFEGAQAGLSREIFDAWFSAVNKDTELPRVHDKKLSILAMCELLKLPPGAIPDSLKDGWAHIVGAILTLFKQLPGAVASKSRYLVSTRYSHIHRA